MHLPFRSTFQMLISSDYNLARKGNIIPYWTGEEDKDLKKFLSPKSHRNQWWTELGSSFSILIFSVSGLVL